MLLTASLAGFRPRRLVVLALACAFTYNLVPYLPPRSRRGSTTRRRRRASGSRRSSISAPTTCRATASRSFRRRSTGRRTGSRRPGFPLARGWFRQIDEVYTLASMRRASTPRSSDAWLRRSAVRYVLLIIDGTARLGRRAARGADRPLASRPGLSPRLPQQGLALFTRCRMRRRCLTGPADPVVTKFGHTVTRVAASSEPGRYFLREHYNPYWHLLGGQDASSRGSGSDDESSTSRGPETFSLTVPKTPGSLVGQIVDGRSARTAALASGSAPAAERRSRSTVSGPWVPATRVAFERCRSTNTSAWSASRISRSSCAGASRSLPRLRRDERLEAVLLLRRSWRGEGRERRWGRRRLLRRLLRLRPLARVSGATARF